MLVKMWGNWDPYDGNAFGMDVENNLAVLQKVQPHNPAISPLDIFARELKI